jgi:hypothetical protein
MLKTVDSHLRLVLCHVTGCPSGEYLKQVWRRYEQVEDHGAVTRP